MTTQQRAERVRTGLERCLDHPREVIGDVRFGLLVNQASVDRQFRHTCDRLAEALPGQLAAVFSPQHGLSGVQQANMVETPHGRHPRWDVPVYSLYSDTRCPTPSMLDSLELLVVDLQDVGTRVYTYIWTVVYCLEACAQAGLPVLILDRPNPLGGVVVEGPLLDPELTSFVGLMPIPMRHGLTVGEIASWAQRERDLNVSLEVCRMDGWRRSMLFPETGLPWVPPSPNMPRFETALLYPGQVLLEGTQLSEGRGTTQPFELVGAPFLSSERLTEELRQLPLPGLAVRPVHFQPTFDKWAGVGCRGVALHVLQSEAVRSYWTTLALLTVVRARWPDAPLWRPPPYEYEREKMPIDLLHGNSHLRQRLDAGDVSWTEVEKLAAVDENAWWSRVAPVLMYD